MLLWCLSIDEVALGGDIHVRKNQDGVILLMIVFISVLVGAGFIMFRQYQRISARTAGIEATENLIAVIESGNTTEFRELARTANGEVGTLSKEAYFIGQALQTSDIAQDSVKVGSTDEGNTRVTVVYSFSVQEEEWLYSVTVIDVDGEWRVSGLHLESKSGQTIATIIISEPLFL